MYWGAGAGTGTGTGRYAGKVLRFSDIQGKIRIATRNVKLRNRVAPAASSSAATTPILLTTRRPPLPACPCRLPFHHPTLFRRKNREPETNPRRSDTQDTGPGQGQEADEGAALVYLHDSALEGQRGGQHRSPHYPREESHHPFPPRRDADEQQDDAQGGEQTDHVEHQEGLEVLPQDYIPRSLIVVRVGLHFRGRVALPRAVFFLNEPSGRVQRRLERDGCYQRGHHHERAGGVSVLVVLDTRLLVSTGSGK
ncbi:UPF0481 protein [Iris pallida]|uniref:UPF0481 protein n=1 Tax=Iris pallida TaxID=29817 RepID=A0AAX6G796_IRIPA|nr:UPF0481 protein [Iris pallida]